MNSNLVDANDTQTKRGIFRSRTLVPPSQIVRTKLSSNPMPTKPNRNKFQSKILNRKDRPTESEVKGKRSQPIAVKEVTSKVVEKPSVRLFEEHFLSTGSQGQDPSIIDSCVKSQNLVENSVQSLLFHIEHCQVDKTTISVSKTLLTNSSSSDVDNNSIPCIMPPQQPPQMDTLVTNSVTTVQNQIHFSDTDLFHKPGLKKFNTFIKNDLDDDSYKTSDTLSLTTALPEFVNQQISEAIPNDVTSASTSTVADIEIGDTIDLTMERSRHIDLFETEMKTYHESLKKYDQQAKDVIDKFTDSLNEKGKIITKYERELSLFNDKVCNIQRQLEESLDHTKQLESSIPKTNPNPNARENANELELENENLKQRIKHLETKLAKRDLHISNLKDVLSLETNKMKDLNKAQEEINNLQRDSIDKSREISILRDELQYAANMRQELINEYDDKIVKLKKLLAIREYLLMKERVEISK